VTKYVFLSKNQTVCNPAWGGAGSCSKTVRGSPWDAFLPRALVTLLLFLSACSTSLERLASQHHLQRSTLTGTGFQHLVLRSDPGQEGATLHVYIDGDGRPWANGRSPAADPTPRRPLALELMVRDDAPSAYVGRPCYFRVAADGTCNSEDWTFGRFSPEIIASMAEVIGDIRLAGDYRDLVIFGYSGGGSVARLVAAKVSNVTALVTIAGNLDTRAWTDAHGYLPLDRSLNPAQAGSLPAGIRHVQIIGDEDQVVPAAVTAAYEASGQPVDVWVYEGFDHSCCWRDAWPDILARLESNAITQ
jgi:dienelactone hydrolase